MGSLSKLSVAELGIGAVRIQEVVKTTNNPAVINSPLYANLVEKERLFTNGFNKPGGSLYTQKVAAFDKIRDNAVSGLFGHVKSLMRSPIPAVAEAAGRVHEVLRTHPSAYVINKKRHTEESGLIRKLLAHIDSAVTTADIETLDLRPWIEAVRTTQDDFEAIYDERSTENATEAEIASATNQRSELEAAIRGFRTFVDANAIVSPDPFWHTLSIQIEERLDEIARNSRSKPRPPQTDNE